MIHLDLFSGIGGFAYAADQVWDNVEHTFVEFDPFCQQVLKKHWPEAEIYGDIKTFNPNPGRKHGYAGSAKSPHWNTTQRSATTEIPERPRGVSLLTGGFPCQPFSAAGLRRGTADERHLWPEMLRVIRLTQPEWVIAENVRGLITWNEGMVLETVCTDLEVSGYEVQPFIIPAVAVNAPHRRDRVWFVANRISPRSGAHGLRDKGRAASPAGTESLQSKDRHTPSDYPEQGGSDDTNSKRPRLQDRLPRPQGWQGSGERRDSDTKPDWGKDWLEIATQLCGVDDGLPGIMGDTTISKAKHRAEQLKAYGNAIVPQVAIEIMRSMK